MNQTCQVCGANGLACCDSGSCDRGLTCAGTVCQPVDECASGTHLCGGHSGSCLNGPMLGWDCACSYGAAGVPAVVGRTYVALAQVRNAAYAIILRVTIALPGRASIDHYVLYRPYLASIPGF